ncbi:P-loop containing nucleoside triphosphate hydrolase protein [Thozetella sp. PMI_491]|nr:P-loop containing nucleoside triphosphate hydrolase protein [Thozetella sp. PMI_491]
MSFYNHSTSSSERRARWSEFQDPVAEERRLKELGKGFAIIHRQSKVEKDDIVTWITASIEAQSPRLRTVLDGIFADYVSWYPDGSPYAVGPPFQPYVHRWEAFLAACQQKDMQSKTAQELQLLRGELEPRIEGHLSALDRVKKTGAISFENLWLILNPGSLMISNEVGPTRVSKLTQAIFVPATKVEPARYELNLAHVEWNGKYCGISVTCSRIVDYNDAISVIKLPVYPVEFAEHWKETEQRLIARGRKYELLRGYHIKACEGKKYTLELDPMRGCLKEVEHPVSGRVIVDAHAYYKVQSKVAPALISLKISRQGLSGIYQPKPGKKSTKKAPNPYPRPGHWRSGPLDDDDDSASFSDTTSSVDAKTEDRDSAHTDSSDRDGERKEDLSSLTDLECVIASPRVKGFDLSNKEWCEFNVEEIKDVVWDPSPYDNLVLPEGERDLVFAFANRPGLSKQGFDDFVAHKGEGIIILLCGPPGVGKTLTAEAVAESSRRPLYIVSASDLGTEAGRVEKGLLNALECCQLWEAVLLIDEADVFLEARDSTNLVRNEVVSIFLRRLEYYRGMMFLTTNRSTAIDSAFKSRIDLIIPYFNLDEPARRKVWVNFIRKLSPGAAALGEDDFDELAKTPLNGREIKNSIKTALVLSNTDKPLRLKHLAVVLRIRKRVETMEQGLETHQA